MPGLKKRDARPTEPTLRPPASPRKSPDPHASGDGNAAKDDGASNWRELAQRIQQETDSGVMLDLVQELITKLDEEKSRKGSSSRK